MNDADRPRHDDHVRRVARAQPPLPAQLPVDAPAERAGFATVVHPRGFRRACDQSCASTLGRRGKSPGWGDAAPGHRSYRAYVPSGAPIDESTYRALAGISAGKLEMLEGTLGLREEYLSVTGLDERSSALVKIAALIALDAPPASYGWQIANALEVGVTPEDILGVLRAIAPQVGAPRAIAAAPEVILALGLSLPEEGGPAVTP